MTVTLSFLFACGLVVITALPAVEGYFLAWTYGRHSGTSSDASIEDDTRINHPRNVYNRATRDDNATTEDELLEVCQSDRTCGRGLYCDNHYGNCVQHKLELEPCRRDGHCDRGLECRFGTCQKVLKLGMEGARCKNDKDCGDNMCCAKQHGESVCKRKLPLNAKCYVPEGGVEYTIDSICPCVDGLVCRRTHQSREEDFVWQFWTDYDHMRCTALHAAPSK
ncbi:dickkopf-related protein 3-like [Asterias amurensis]|uniref:dickkopf-related protein 3-like n=1 Tax=Asterias amurensis TaxID=7602 RepID=UPI003AB4BDD2